MTAKPGRAPLPPRWFVRSAWAIHRTLYAGTGGRLGLLHQFIDLGCDAQITGSGECALAEIGLKRIERIGACSREHHARTLAVQRFGDGAAYAARSAGDECGLVGEIEHSSHLRAFSRKLRYRLANRA